jgi:hypothetical protein
MVLIWGKKWYLEVSTEFDWQAYCKSCGKWPWQEITAGLDLYLYNGPFTTCF